MPQAARLLNSESRKSLQIRSIAHRQIQAQKSQEIDLGIKLHPVTIRNGDRRHDEEARHQQARGNGRSLKSSGRNAAMADEQCDRRPIRQTVHPAISV
jgi:hypothetical protein